MEYTIYNATIVTIDLENTIYINGAMRIKNGIIEEIGNKLEVNFKGELIDMNGKIIMPGLINAHTHTHSPLFKNILDDMKLMQWLKEGLWPLERKITSQNAKNATECSCLEFIKNGITTYADQFFYADDIATVAQKSGLRCFLAATVLSDGCAESKNTVDTAENFIKKWIGKEDETLVYPCIGPHAPYSVTQSDWEKVVELAKKYNIIIHTHISETKDENEQIKNKYNLTPTQWLNTMNVFSQKVLAAHSIHLTEEDIKIYRDNNVSAVYNPVSNLKLTSGLMPIEKLFANGINVAIGTDGSQSNNSLDLLQDMKIGSLIQKQKLEDATFLDATQSVKMMTINGAKALGMEKQIGSLEVGKKADFISFNPNSINFKPIDFSNYKNIYSAIIYTAIGSDVEDTVVNGKWLMKNKNVLSLNEKEVLTKIQKDSLEIRKP